MKRRFPAEWEPHTAVWIAWPHEESDFPGKLPAVAWVYTEIVRLFSLGERVEILFHSEALLEEAKTLLEISHIPLENVGFHLQANDRSWLRDSAPTAVYREDGSLEWIQWRFNAWAKYDNFLSDQHIPSLIASHTKIPCTQAYLADGKTPMVLEGGAIDTDGEGTLLVTEECLLSEVQQRNAGLSAADYEALFLEYLGITKTIWLPGGCVGDDTHGHIDDIARFAPNGKVLLAVEEDPSDENYEVTQENRAILSKETNASGKPLEVLSLPFPSARVYDDLRLPASYANFYITNQQVIVPVFNDVNDSKAMNIIASAFPEHQVLGLYAGDLVLGQGTLHCLSQQQPAQ